MRDACRGLGCRYAGEVIKGDEAHEHVKLKELMEKMETSPFDNMLYHKDLPQQMWRSILQKIEVHTLCDDVHWFGHADACRHGTKRLAVRADGWCGQVPEALQEVSVDFGLSLSTTSTGQSFHTHGPSWLGLVAGRKQWVIAPPSEAFEQANQPLDCTAGKGSSAKLPKGAVELIQEAGDIVYVPADWHHATCNLSPFTESELWC